MFSHKKMTRIDPTGVALSLVILALTVIVPGAPAEALETDVCRIEILVDGRKLVGSAQRRTGDVFLQHGSILTGPGHTGLADCLPAASGGGTSREQLAAGTTDLGQLLPGPIDEAEYERRSLWALRARRLPV